ncbi:Tripartite-type tricarboxylate transporter, receptor component TctC [Tindallia magadiensis]|uniref:Tripartite-type tricarboxylate transporter, receptor component TctC n=1 Tax=Tindallia magadiensis TaxID=69895 RepID=A0A1I3EWX8_9FIRM|nr:tripartite tricarboxylate transporter substrate binding protein [Tindallia magadiensis]SFI03051.1 Tripartite-type tricarboxylate transporter, receptor component TctC [Tindallia magadiensis]
MFKTKKWSMIMILVAVLIVSMTFTGCGSQEEAADAGSQTENGQEASGGNGYPTRNIELAVPFSAGGGTDLAARVVAPFLADELGVNVLVENREGAGTQIGITHLLRSGDGDEGYSVLFATQPHASNTIIGQGAEYSIEDIHWLNFHHIDPVAVNVAEDAPWDDLAELIDYIAENPGEVSIGVAQMGGGHIFMEYLIDKLGIEPIMVPYDGGGDVRTAFLGGHVDVAFTNVAPSAQLIDQSKSLGVGWNERSSIWPDAPSFDEIFDDEEIIETAMGLASCRGIAVTSTFKENHPDRYEILLAAYEAAFNHEDHIQEMVDNGQMPISQWIGPEEANRIAETTHRTLSQFEHLY